ncbi:MAG: FAD-binding protein [Chloroflexi bacterium]|nr:FAD-binding protein [Chloroflexota bacterium]
MNKRRLIKGLERIVGRGAVLHHPDDLLVFEYDGSVDRAAPTAVVFPTSTHEVSDVVALAHREGIPVVPRGAGTGLSGGSIAVEGGIEIALTRMRRILKIDAANRIAIVEPGLVNLDLSQATARFGLFFAPDPSSQRACTIGGNVAENAGGPHCLRYGVTTNHVIGLEVVLEDGSVVSLGDRFLGWPGYDLVGAFVGSEGTMGVVTRVVARLLPVPQAVRTLLAVFPTVDQASSAVSRVIGSGMVPTALEMMDSLAIKAADASVHAGYPKEAGAVLLVEVDGLTEAVEEEAAEVQQVCERHQPIEIRTATDPLEREKLWAARKGVLGALGHLAPNYSMGDGTVPRTRLPEVMARVGEISKEFGLPIANVLHAGDGNLHPAVLFDERNPDETRRAYEAGGEILKLCVEVGGALTGEHGIGLEKQEYMPLMFSADDLEAMAGLKVAFGTGDLLNPGKIFPTGKSLPGASQSAAVGRAGAGAYI